MTATAPKYRGVTFDGSGKRKQRWKAQLYRKGLSPKYLGRFDIPEDAARAYDKAAFALYGEKADMNFPDEYAVPA